METKVTEHDLADLSSDNPRVKYGRAKSLLTIARCNPDELYPHLPFFCMLLKSDNNILKWTAIDIIGSLSSVDTDRRIEPLIARLVRFLRAGRLITANHAVNALTQIARSKPTYRGKITRQLLNVEKYAFETEECQNIVLGKVVQALGVLYGVKGARGEIEQFVRRQTRNSRPATRKKAEKLLAALTREKIDRLPE